MEGREYKGIFGSSLAPDQGYVPLWKWIAGWSFNIILGTVIFFLAASLCVMLFLPGLYETEADLYIAAKDGDTKVTAAALGEYLGGNGSNGITEGLYGFSNIPAGLRFRTEYDLGKGLVRVRSVSSDPYSAFDTVKKAIDISRKYLESKDVADTIRVVRTPEIAEHKAYSLMLIPALAAAVLGFVLSFVLTVIGHGYYTRVYRQNEREVISSYVRMTREKPAEKEQDPELEDYAELSDSYETTYDPDEETLKKLLSALEEAGYGSGQTKGGE